MLNKQVTPSFDDLIRYCGESGKWWLALDQYLVEDLGAAKLIRFPYGNKYGWGVKYSRKSKHICDAFAENGSFSMLSRVSNDAMAAIYLQLSDYGKTAWDNKYPCGNGGWLNFRVLEEDHLQDVNLPAT